MDGLRLGNRIRAFRKLKGYTQQEFAKELGISVAVLGSIERGMKTPTEKMLNRMVNILDVGVGELRAQEEEN
ncbi:MAG TPA: helix-turn-helix transcriptional regulator [Bacillota bacterium]|nr:helix-turn-helix transcriptional regulator [Bacillota bacterium]